MLARLKELGYDFVYGIPGPLIPVDAKDHTDWEPMSCWGEYENGGCCGQTAYHFIQSLYNAGSRAGRQDPLHHARHLRARADPLGLVPRLHAERHWRTKGGAACGYNYLADNYYFLLAAVTGHYGVKFPPLQKPQGAAIQPATKQ